MEQDRVLNIQKENWHEFCKVFAANSDAQTTQITRKTYQFDEYPDKHIIVLENVLSPEECQFFIKDTERLGTLRCGLELSHYMNFLSERKSISFLNNFPVGRLGYEELAGYRKEYRSNTRVIVPNVLIGHEVWKRVQGAPMPQRFFSSMQ